MDLLKKSSGPEVDYKSKYIIVKAGENMKSLMDDQQNEDIVPSEFKVEEQKEIVQKHGLISGLVKNLILSLK